MSATAYLGIGLALSATPLALLDPVLSGIVSMVAMIIGGSACCGPTSPRAIPAFGAIVISLTNLYLLGHIHGGVLNRPTLSSLMGLVVVASFPLVVTAILIATGLFRRTRNKGKS